MKTVAEIFAERGLREVDRESELASTLETARQNAARHVFRKPSPVDEAVDAVAELCSSAVYTGTTLDLIWRLRSACDAVLLVHAAKRRETEQAAQNLQGKVAVDRRERTRVAESYDRHEPQHWLYHAGVGQAADTNPDCGGTSSGCEGV